jgi:hypothetical protein
MAIYALLSGRIFIVPHGTPRQRVNAARRSARTSAEAGPRRSLQLKRR